MMATWKTSDGTRWDGPNSDGNYTSDNPDEFRPQSHEEIAKYWGPMVLWEDPIERAKALLEDVTNGPWTIREEIDGMRSGRKTVVWAGVKRIVSVDQTRPHHDACAEGNVAFISAARQLVPELIAEIERLRGRE